VAIIGMAEVNIAKPHILAIEICYIDIEQFNEHAMSQRFILNARFFCIHFNAENLLYLPKGAESEQISKYLWQHTNF
jgi:hypothetical protein